MNKKLYSSFKVVDFNSKEGFLIRSYIHNKTNKRTVLVFNPICIKIGLIVPLLNELSQFYNVVTWECRGTHSHFCPSVIDDSNINVSLYLEDLKNILTQENINVIDHIIGYSSGCEIATIASQSLIDFKNIVFISPSFKFKNVKKTTFQISSEIVCKNIAEKDKSYIKLLIETANENNCKNDENKSLDMINRDAFTNENTILSYAYFHNDLYSYNQENIISNITKNILLIHSQDDEFVHSDVSVYAKKIKPSIDLVVKPKGGHYVFHHDFSVIEKILSFMWRNI